MTPETFLTRHAPAMLIEITATKGSAPRETDAYMLVAPEATFGTIGGGQLEFLAIDHARALLSGDEARNALDIPLGPEIGQCCGGRVEISFSLLDETAQTRLEARLAAEALARPEVWLFGGGHVGRALAQALALLPLKTTVVETRTEELSDLPKTVSGRLCALPEGLVGEADPGAAIVILTHDHALDFLIARQALARSDLAYVGMIGSKSKRAAFTRFARKEGLADPRIEKLVLPIGGTAVRDKRPAVIAAMTVAEILAAIAAYRPVS